MKNLLYGFKGRANSETLIQPAFQRFLLFDFVPHREQYYQGCILTYHKTLQSAREFLRGRGGSIPSPSRSF